MPPKTTEAKSTEDKPSSQRSKNLDLALQQIAKDYGEGAIMRLGDHSQTDVEVIPTGNILIDRALGVGGFPRGRIVEIYGPESSGKTTLTLTVVAQAQKRGGLAAFIDVEHALDPKYAQRLGVNLGDLLEDPHLGGFSYSLQHKHNRPRQSTQGMWMWGLSDGKRGDLRSAGGCRMSLHDVHPLRPPAPASIAGLVDISCYAGLTCEGCYGG